jgi:hypothetical protein
MLRRQCAGPQSDERIEPCAKIRIVEGFLRTFQIRSKTGVLPVSQNGESILPQRGVHVGSRRQQGLPVDQARSGEGVQRREALCAFAV